MIDQEKIHEQCLNEDPKERINAIEQLKDNFSLLPDKEKAWNDLHKLATNNYSSVRYWVASALGSVFSDLPDKQQAWNDLHKLTTDKDRSVRSMTIDTLGSIYFQVPDKRQAWKDLVKLIIDEDWYVREEAANVLSFVFPHLHDKQQAWNDLHRLTNDKEWHVRRGAAGVLGIVFSHLFDKEQACDDLHRLTIDEVSYVRMEAASSFYSAFSHLPDKEPTWNDLHRLIGDEDSNVRDRAARALGFVFYDVPDKQQAWDDLHRLTKDENSYVRSGATSAIGSALYCLPNKEQAWNDLHRLTNDENNFVRRCVAHTLGSIFFHLSDKEQAWNDDLHKLITDEDRYVRAYANHSCGKLSIFQASHSKNEDDYRKKLEDAIIFFETASQNSSSWVDPSQFCLPFYRSFYTIVFKKQEAKNEVDKDLEEVKAAIEGSKSKELLFEAVNNLANALKEVQSLENLDLESTKGELNFYRKYCDRAAELMIETEEAAPFATIAMRKGLPILDRNLKELLEEIQKKAKIACKESKGTDTEEIACTINSEIQRWEIGSQEEMAFNLENLIFTLEANTPRNLQTDIIIDRIKQIPEQKDVAKQYSMLNSIITLIIKSSSEQKLQEIGEKVDQIGNKLEEITIFLKPGISEELIIHVGPITQWGGIEYTMSIPLQDISYPELKEDLQKIVGKKIDKLSKMPSGLANKVRDYLVQKKMWSILDKLT